MKEVLLYDPQKEHSSCGVGFIAHKAGKQTHELLEHSHQALCTIPHRGGMSAEGIGDGAGVNIDLSLSFFSHLLQQPSLKLGRFAVGNFFLPTAQDTWQDAIALVEKQLTKGGISTWQWRDVPVDPSVLNTASQAAQSPIKQVIFHAPDLDPNVEAFEQRISAILGEIEAIGFTTPELDGFYPLSMSAKTQVYKGRLNSWEVVPYFLDLMHEHHQVASLFFHTRFSTNTAPATMMAQPFRRMAHNGELNTDKKNRLSEDAIARQNNKKVIFPKGQSDSARLDQTLARRIIEDKLDIVTAVLAMMPPAWENQHQLDPKVRDMLAYFSLYEEKNDGPAALVFSDGDVIGARLDRLGLRPLRSVETHDYLAVMSEAGQIDFEPSSVLRRGRIEAGGMICLDKRTGEIRNTDQILADLAQEQDYGALLAEACIDLEQLAEIGFADLEHHHAFDAASRHVAYSLNQESFKFFLDPMISTGMEKVTAMGFGLAPNALTEEEGGMSKYFSQRFAQVTNPPLDALRESDGMTLRVALGAKPNFSVGDSVQLVCQSPIFDLRDIMKIEAQTAVSYRRIEMLYSPLLSDLELNEKQLIEAIENVCDQVEQAARERIGIVILSDRTISEKGAAIPAILMVAAANQRLIQKGVRFNTSIVIETGQAVSSHDVACLLGFGASAVCPLSVHYRIAQQLGDDALESGLKSYKKAVHKSLMKTMGKFGLCTAESYIGGEFFESNFLNTQDANLTRYFPNIASPVGGATFANIAYSAAHWHYKALRINGENQIPLLGLFKERQEGAGHSFGNTAVREYLNMTEEDVAWAIDSQIDAETVQEAAEPNPQDLAYLDFSYEARTPAQIDAFDVTPAYRQFAESLYQERAARPAALRDVMCLPVDLNQCDSQSDFVAALQAYQWYGNGCYLYVGIETARINNDTYELSLKDNPHRHAALIAAFEQCFGPSKWQDSGAHIQVKANAKLAAFLNLMDEARDPIALAEVAPAHEITASLASGAMSHGALNANAHEAVAQGTNMAGAMSNSGEGGEHASRYNTIKSSKIKQFASGRFGVWTGYLADPNLEEIEIKLAQGAKPGEGGQLPSAKVTVEIAAARGGTPGIELVSPPPHHDTYSIEDLAQLIHDAKSARVRVIVKLVSSEGIGTIAVGVAKAGADVINVAGNTGGTGAAAVTSLKHTGRAAELGIAEVHQALSENGLRDKVILRCSNAHQTGLDVVKSAIMGGDSFEFGTTALMMLKCVMAKNCNVKCPAGITTNPEMYQGDARALAQYFINLAHEVREILAQLGYRSLAEIRGQTHLLHLAHHAAIVGQLDFRGLLRYVPEIKIDKPIYLEANFDPDSDMLTHVDAKLLQGQQSQLALSGYPLNNCNKSVGAQLAIDIERVLNYQLSDDQLALMPKKVAAANLLSAADIANHPAVHQLPNGRRVLAPETLSIETTVSAGQSYGAFINSGMHLRHLGTCNDGVGKGASGGIIAVQNPGGGEQENVLVGNFALFGATGGQLYVNGSAGDRFGVRNSGAVAVVEGVGDFCCEYMTGGSIVNLGGYGHGFGNGMSGGVAFQYDPSGQFAPSCNQESVRIQTFDQTSLSDGMATALQLLLQDHVRHTQSALAQSLLDNWPAALSDFVYMVPEAFYQTQTLSALSQSLDRKAALEELASWQVAQQLDEISQAWQTQTFIAEGDIPAYGETDTPLCMALVARYGFLSQICAEVEKIHGEPLDGSDAQSHLVRKAMQTRDKKLLDPLLKSMRTIFCDYDDEALAILLAHKRLTDYKQALARRNVVDNHAFAITVWIYDQQLQNQEAMASLEPWIEKMAVHYCHALAERMREYAEQQKNAADIAEQNAMQAKQTSHEGQ
uniref:glutamate synthase-related protein n=1 Tax=Thaumasiovibrio occultus TaxID=1891184 RepID=UPI000B34E030|nr:glutamate synthase-related protein [Thaumasiovibrio occultus]